MKSPFFSLMIACGLLAGMLAACGGSNASADTQTQTGEVEIKGSLLSGLSGCDDVVQDYDKLITKYMKIAEAGLDGQEIDQAQKKELEAEAQRLGKRVQELGVAGLGGTECWQQFAQLQMKWAQAATQLQQKAMEKAQEQMRKP